MTCRAKRNALRSYLLSESGYRRYKFSSIAQTQKGERKKNKIKGKRRKIKGKRRKIK
ncbi:MAG: hypothetical protein WBI07_02215 [Mobilitalea sp.]